MAWWKQIGQLHYPIYHWSKKKLHLRVLFFQSVERGRETNDFGAEVLPKPSGCRRRVDAESQRMGVDFRQQRPRSHHRVKVWTQQPFLDVIGTWTDSLQSHVRAKRQGHAEWSFEVFRRVVFNMQDWLWGLGLLCLIQRAEETVHK